MGKKSPNKGFQRVSVEELEEAAKQLDHVVGELRKLSGRMAAEKLPPISLPFASRKRAVTHLVDFADILEGKLRRHRREHEAFQAGTAQAEEDAKSKKK